MEQYVRYRHCPGNLFSRIESIEHELELDCMMPEIVRNCNGRMHGRENQGKKNAQRKSRIKKKAMAEGAAAQ